MKEMTQLLHRNAATYTEKLRHWSNCARLTSEGVTCLSPETMLEIAGIIDELSARCVQPDAVGEIVSRKGNGPRVVDFRWLHFNVKPGMKLFALFQGREV